MHIYYNGIYIFLYIMACITDPLIGHNLLGPKFLPDWVPAAVVFHVQRGRIGVGPVRYSGTKAHVLLISQ